MKFLIGLSLVLCLGQASAADNVVLRLHGSNTIGARLAPAVVEAWMKQQGMTGVRREEVGHEEQVVSAKDARGNSVAVEIYAHGSSTAFSALAAGKADLGMASRPIKVEEAVQLAAHGDMRAAKAEYVIGLDGIAVIVHPRNPLTSLDKDSLARIFSGDVRDWSRLGGSPGPIRVYARDDKSGTYDTFKSLVLDKTALAADARRYESSNELSDAVAQDEGGIGFIGLPYVRRAKPLAVSERETHAISPTPFAVATEDYALARRLFFYVPSEGTHPLARALAEFAVSTDGQLIAEQEGFVSQAIAAGSLQAVPAEAPEEYRQLIKGARRLSVNFRFREGSPAPDNKALRDLDRMLEFMGRTENVGRHVILCGFSDKDEVIPLYSLDLSIQRADRIADLLIRKGVRPLRVRGYGTSVPVAANDTFVGRQKNRRVEVWIR